MNINSSAAEDRTIYHADECAICYEDFSQNNDCLLLRCGHVFHTTCLTEWDESSPNTVCPLCRKEFYSSRKIAQVFPEAASEGANVARKIFVMIALFFGGIAALIAVGHVLKRAPWVIGAIGNHLTSKTDPAILVKNPPLIVLDSPKDHLIALLVICAIPALCVTTYKLAKHGFKNYRMRDFIPTRFQYHRPPTS